MNNKLEKYITEATLPKDLMNALNDFKNAIRDNHGEPLTPMEIKFIKKEIDRLAKGYKGM
jgi:hypothetical protein